MEGQENPQKRDFAFKNPLFQNKYIKIIAVVLCFVLALTIIIGVAVGCYYAGVRTQLQSNINNELALGNEVYDLINKYYYKDISKDDFNKYAAVGLASVMDKYSGLSLAYNIETAKWGFNIKSDSYNNHIIANVLVGSAVDEANGVKIDETGNPVQNGTSYKIERGDILYSVNGQNVQGLNNDKLNDINLLGRSNCDIVVKKTDGTLAKFNVTKNLNPTKSARYVNWGNGIGYIKLDSFTGTAAEDFVSCANQFIASDAQKLILDLRDNGGGSSNILSTIAGYIIHDGKGKSDGLPILRIKMEKAGKVEGYFASGNNWFGNQKQNYELAVLVNEGSASASEALLGAINYYCPEATIIGSETYGKGIAQQTFELKNGPYLLSMTVGNFYVPVAVNGDLSWQTFHNKPMKPTEGCDIGTLSGYDFTSGKLYADYYNNNLKAELAVAKAIEVLA